MGQAFYFDSLFEESRNIFEKMTARFPNHFFAYWWLANACVAIQPDAEYGLAKPAYEKLIPLITDKVKYKAQLITAHSYLGAYYYMNKQNDESRKEWESILEIDPENEQALKVLKVLKK